MADKELTVFLLDATVSSTAYKYVFDTLAGKILKGLKTDFVTVVLFNSTTTKHDFAGEGKFVGIEILLNFETVSFQNLQMLDRRLRGTKIVNKDPILNSADTVQTVLFASTLFAPTLRKVFTRNIVLVSDGTASYSAESTAKIDRIPAFYGELQVNFHGVAANFTSGSLEHTSMGKIKNSFPSGTLFKDTEASKMLEHHPPIRKTRPVAAYTGDLRLGSDFDQLTKNSEYNPNNDNLCVNFRVEVYPAAKSDTQVSDTHEYIVDSEQNIVRLERNTTNYIWEKNVQKGTEKDKITETEPQSAEAEKNYDRKNVDSHSLTPAFKFSNFDLIALDDDLLKATKLALFSSFDIFGFIPATAIPYEFFTDESYYVVPEKISSIRNTTSFQAFVGALHTKKLAALCRWVRKSEKEVEVGAVFPVKINSESGYTNCLIFIRLPFQEDEKVGRFPPLAEKSSNVDESVNKKELEKIASLSSMMDDFVSAKSLDDDEEIEEISPTDVINNFKVTMKVGENSKLALPSTRKNVDPFLCSSPSANRYQKYLRETLLKSLSAQNWVQFFENPEFITENLRDHSSFTNFFNLENCLAVNASKPDPNWLIKLNEKSISKSKRLASALGSKYVRKAETKKKKLDKTATNFYQKGNYGADEGTYDAVPEFEF